MILSNIYFVVNKATEGCEVLMKVVTGVNLADPAQTGIGCSSRFYGYFQNALEVSNRTTFE